MGSQISFFADDIAPGISVLFDANYCIILNFCFHVYFSYIIHVTSVYIQKLLKILILSTDYGAQNTEAMNLLSFQLHLSHQSSVTFYYLLIAIYYVVVSAVVTFCNVQ